MGLYILVPLSVVLVFAIGIIFWWSVRSGQFDDLEGPGFRMLVDDRDEISAASEFKEEVPAERDHEPLDPQATQAEPSRDGLDPDQMPPRS